jgi:hypothetical protein
MPTTNATQGPSHWEVVLRAWEQLDLPEGWRAEIIEGDIVLTDPFGEGGSHASSMWDVVLGAWRGIDLPEGWRARIADFDMSVSRRPEGAFSDVLDRLSDRLVQWGPSGTVTARWSAHASEVRVPELGFLASPDLIVQEEATPLAAGAGIPGSAVLLAAEVAPEHGGGRTGDTGRRAYAHAAVPVYLLVHPADSEVGGAPTVTCHSRPEQGSYRRVDRTPLGDPLYLPEPFDLTLDTSGFPA